MARELQQTENRTDRRPTTRRRRWVVLGVTAVLLLGGCATVPSNTPDDYGQVTEDNYLSACEESGEDRSDCECFYDGIVDTVAFDEFKDFEQRVEDDPTDVPGPYQTIVDDCLAGNTVGPTADVDDTTTTTASEPS